MIKYLAVNPLANSYKRSIEEESSSINNELVPVSFVLDLNLRLLRPQYPKYSHHIPMKTLYPKESNSKLRC